MKLATLHIMDDYLSRDPNGPVTPWTAYYTRARGEGITLATHQGKVRDPKVVVQALWPRVVRTSLNDMQVYWLENGTEWCFMRRVQPWSAEDLTQGCRMMDEMTAHGEFEGQKPWRYSPLELAFQAMDGRIEKTLPLNVRKRMRGVGPNANIIFFRKLGDILANRVICSRTGNRIDANLGSIPQWLRHGSPDDTWDYKWTVRGEYTWDVVDHSEGWYDPITEALEKQA